MTCELGQSASCKRRKSSRSVAKSRRPTALLVFDLDHFKSVNDTFGHQTGDRLLQGFAAMLAAELRPGDRVMRIGGEEFAALLAETELRDAEGVAERLRASWPSC